jgi:hypothetical protein
LRRMPAARSRSVQLFASSMRLSHAPPEVSFGLQPIIQFVSWFAVSREVDGVGATGDITLVDDSSRIDRCPWRTIGSRCNSTVSLSCC